MRGRLLLVGPRPSAERLHTHGLCAGLASNLFDTSSGLLVVGVAALRDLRS